MCKYAILFLMLYMASKESLAQFTGGNADGYSGGLLTQSTCTPLVSNFAFYGGNADGHSDALLMQSNCTPLVSNFAFYGGIADGYSDALLTQSNCTPLVSNFAFYGGNADGYSDALLTQSNCTPLISNFAFYGGNADGYSAGLLTQSNCTPLISNFAFYGGNADGYSAGLLTQSSCPPLISNFAFYGGRADGFTYFVINRSPCLNITPLPIELLSFTAKRNDLVVDVKWQTGSEINNDYFTVEKSRDGDNYSPVGIVAGAGNSNELLNYETTDYTPYEGVSYYRLKQTDYDGKFEYSHIIALDFSTDEYGISIYPNPTNDFVTIDFVEQSLMPPGVVSLTNMYGEKKELDQTIISNNQIKVDLSQLPSGIYFIGIHFGQKAVERKIVVQK